MGPLLLIVLGLVALGAGVLVLRKTRPDLSRGFKVPLVPLVPILGILICGYLMSSLPGDTWLRLVIWMAIGLVIYFAYGRRRSRFAGAPPTR